MDVQVDYKAKEDNLSTIQAISKHLNIPLTIFGLLRNWYTLYTLLNAHSTCPLNGIEIRQLEVSQTICFSFI